MEVVRVRLRYLRYERAECSTEMDQHVRRLEHRTTQCSAWDVELSAIRRAKVLASRESGYRVAHSRQVVGVIPWRHLNTWTQTLKRTRSVTSSQCKMLRRMCVRPLSYLRVFDTRRTAALTTRCNLSVVFFGVPTNRLPQWSTRLATKA